MTFHPVGQTIGNLVPPLTIANGGTGQTTQSAALTALLGSSIISRANGGTGVGTTPAAPASFAPANPGSTVSATLVMMGLGSTITYTPASSGKVLVVASGTFSIATTIQSGTVGGRFGTGAAPTNGTAVTGTLFGGVADLSLKGSTAGVANGISWALNTILSLTPATAYWFDVAILTGNTSDAASVQAVQFSLVELS